MDEPTFSWEDRCIVNEAIRDNIELLHFKRFNSDVCEVAQEMYTVTLVPFDPTKAKSGVPTQDRHLRTCVGNNGELVSVLTLNYHGWMEPNDIRLATSWEEQDAKKLDLITHSFNVQIKTASRGNTRDGKIGQGQVFVKQTDLEGHANYVAYVDGRYRCIYVIKRLSFVEEMKRLEYKPHDKWWGHTGWWITPVPETYENVTVLDIPDAVATTFTDPDIGRTVLSKRYRNDPTN